MTYARAVYEVDDGVLARFQAKVEQGPGCWLWTAATQGGYGVFAPRKSMRVYAHRLAYELAYGAIPHGLQIDHLCRQPGCVRPEHLEAVTARVNVLRSSAPTAVNARKTRCRRGHPLPTKRNAEGRRRCAVCPTMLAVT